MAKANQTTVTNQCFHCGDDCIEEIVAESKSFCCHGCLAVYQLLEETGLTDYYQFTEKPGTKQSQDAYLQYDYLDTPAVENQLLLFENARSKRVKVEVPDIHCSSCIWLLENLSKLNPGITSSEVSFTKKELTIDYDPSLVRLSEIAHLLLRIGYPPTINLGSKSKKAKNSGKSLMLKLGIAGFAFGNIMLLSFPEYFGFEVEKEFQNFFAFISMALSIPVLVYSANGYFIAAWKGLRQQFISIDVPIALGIATLFIRSAYEVILQVGTGYFDSLAGLVFFLLIGKWVQQRSYRQLSFERDYKSYFPLAVLRNVKNGEQVATPVSDLQVDDELFIRNGEVIPTDCQLLDERVDIDYSFVTGESDLVQKTLNAKIYAGAKVFGQAARFRVLKPVSQSYLSSLWGNFSKEDKEASRSLIDSISKYFTIAVVSVAILSLAYWWGISSSAAIQVFAAVLIVACPCALALATPFTLNAALSVLGQNGFYLKKAEVVERLWKISQLVFDKTGTLTELSTNSMKYVGQKLSPNEQSAIHGIVSNSTHPLSARIGTYLSSVADETSLLSFKEYEGQGLEAMVGNNIYRLGTASFIGATDNNSKHNGATVWVGINAEPRGYFEVRSSLRKGLAAAIGKLGSSYKMSVISGDNDREELLIKESFPAATKLRFRQQPHQKLNYVESLASKEQVMMLGDGLNDAGALAKSDVGVAVTENITSFTPASDAILEGIKLRKLPQFMTFIGRVRLVLISAFAISFLYNVVGLSFAITGQLSPLVAAILMPISSVSVVAVSTFGVKYLAKKMNLL